MSEIIFAVVTPAEASDARNLLRDLTLSWTRYGYRGQLIEAESIERALASALNAQASYCLVQSIGHVIDEQWYLPHWQKFGFYEGLQDLIRKGDFLVAGEWFVSSSGCPGLHADCLLVDLERYRALGSPEFGNPELRRRFLPAPEVQLPGDFQFDDLEWREVPVDSVGWNFLQTSAVNRLPVRRLGCAMNDCRFNLAGEGRIDELYAVLGKSVAESRHTEALSFSQRAFIKRIEKQLLNAKRGVFLFNIESYADLSQVSGSHRPLDALFSVAAGFKPYKILQTRGFHAETKVILFDYSAAALEIRRYMVERWDGVDFTSFIKDLFQVYRYPDAYYQLWFGATPENMDWNDVEHLWQLELSKWGGAAAFQEHWLACRKLTHEYMLCDLLESRQALLSELARHKNIYVWWSNAFFTIFSHWHYSASARRREYLAWIRELAQVAPNCQISGADHNNHAVNNLIAKDYLDELLHNSDAELNTQSTHSVPIRF